MYSALHFRSWLEVANDEKRTRGGPICFIENLEMGVEYFNIQIIEKLRIKPTLGLIFKAPRRLYSKQGILFILYFSSSIF